LRPAVRGAWRRPVAHPRPWAGPGADADASRDPGVARCGTRRPGLGAEFPVQLERTILEVVREEGALELLAELPGRRRPELDRPQAVADPGAPPPVVPRPDHDRAEVPRVLLFPGLVDLQRAVEVLLVPPAGDVQGRDLRPCQEAIDRLTPPESVVVRVVDEVVPGRQLAVEVALIGGGQRPEGQEPLVRVVPVELEELHALGGLHPRDVLEPV